MSNAPLLQDLAISADAWSQFDLDSRRPLLDQAATQCQSSKDQSLAARKTLSEITKKFKKGVKACETSLGNDRNTVVENLTSQCRTVVKSYQEEIDKLTRRCKSSDSNFLNLYQSIYELPDPAVILRPVAEYMNVREEEVIRLQSQMESLLIEMDKSQKENQNLELVKKEMEQKLKSAEAASSTMSNTNSEELISLRKEVSEYEIEFRGLKNQDITIRKLEAKIAQLQRDSQAELSESLKKAQEQLAQTEGRRASEALEREAKMERKVQSLELELRAERAGRRAQEASALDASEGEGEREAAWEAQRQILVDDSESLRQLLHDVQRERDDLRLKLDISVGGDNDNVDPIEAAGNSIEFMAEKKAYEAEVSELSLTVSSLRDELKANEDNVKGVHSSMQANIDDLREECNDLSRTVDSLNSQLADAPSQTQVENMRRELRILKRLEYNAEDQDVEEYMESDSNYAENNKDPEMTTDDLESVLVSRLRKMESNLLHEKRESTEAKERYRVLEKEVESLQEIKTSSDKLISSLEADLSKAISASPSPFKASSTHTLSLTGENSESSTLSRIIDPNSTDALDPTMEHANKSILTPPTSNAALEKSNDDHSVATIVIAQRDRLRVRCDALEAERDSFKKELQIQVQCAESLKADNTKLYEKVRYLQNFSQNSNRVPSNITHRGSDLDLEALEERYEASVDPFRQFGRAERVRKLKEMTHLERFVFVSAKFVLGSKQMRTALVVYVLSMHFLVFVTTYHWAHEGKCGNLELHPMLEHIHGGPPIDETALAMSMPLKGPN